MASTHHIYIHFPYCLYKCHYCDFNSYAWEAHDIPHQSYASAILNEFQQRQEFFAAHQDLSLPPGSKVASVFFGGGTPSLMRPEDVGVILQALRQQYSFKEDIEITLEANPGTVSQENLLGFYEAGVNRISLGVQSFAEKNLTRFGRIHSGEQASQALQLAIDSPIERVSADLIFGFPEQTLADWQKDLDTLLTFNLTHFSAYALTAEQGTSYTQALADKKYHTVTDDVSAAMFGGKAARSNTSTIK